MTTITRTWSNYILESRIEAGYAAQKNRGRFTGTKMHRLQSEYIVGLVDEAAEPAGTLGARFIVNRKPILFSCRPMCGCTQGQHAASPRYGATLDQVNCTRC